MLNKNKKQEKHILVENMSLPWTRAHSKCFVFLFVVDLDDQATGRLSSFLLLSPNLLTTHDIQIGECYRLRTIWFGCVVLCFIRLSWIHHNFVPSVAHLFSHCLVSVRRRSTWWISLNKIHSIRSAQTWNWIVAKQINTDRFFNTILMFVFFMEFEWATTPKMACIFEYNLLDDVCVVCARHFHIIPCRVWSSYSSKRLFLWISQRSLLFYF